MSRRNIGVKSLAEKQIEEVSSVKLFSQKNFLFLIGILFIAAVIFGKTFKNDFTDWDDDLYVVNAEIIRHFDLASWFTTFTANLYTPLVTASYAIDYKLYGLDPSGYHATNLLLHAINICLVFFLTIKVFKRTFIAVISALLSAIHPLNTEAVVWISSRKDLLFTIFYLLGLLAYVRYLEKRALWTLISVFVLFVFSVLSKPVAFTFPFVLLALDYLVNRNITARNFTEKIPFFIISFLIACLGVYLVRKYEVFATAPFGYNLFDKICLAGFSLAFYLYNAFIPADVSNYHAYPFKESTMLGAKYIFAPLVLLVVLSLVYLAIKKNNFKLVIGFVIFLVVIGPTLRLIPTGYPIAADRYFYLASIGLFWTVILLLEKLYNISFAFKCFVIALGFIFLCAFSVVSFRRVSDWKDSFTLWNSTLKNNPWHEMANDHLGKLYDKAGDKDLALMHFERILQRDTTKYDIMNSAGNILIEKHRPALAMKYFNSAIATGKADHLPYYNRGMLYSDEGKFSLAIKDFDKALLLKPDLAEGFNNRGIAKVQIGDTLGAYADFQKAVQYKPSDQMMKDNLARIKLYLPSH